MMFLAAANHYETPPVLVNRYPVGVTSFLIYKIFVITVNIERCCVGQLSHQAHPTIKC